MGEKSGGSDAVSSSQMMNRTEGVQMLTDSADNNSVVAEVD